MKRSISKLVQRAPRVYRAINRLRGYRLHSPDTNPHFVRLGSDYGGWGVPENFLNAASVVYSVGTGEDISFDLEVIRKYGCDVFAFDPTPMARAFVEEILPPQQFRFLEIGLAGTDGDAKFFPPTQMGFHSFSIKAEGGSRSGVPITRPVRRLSTIMSDLGHQRVDLLKMDIEGFEYSVLEDILDTKVEPDCLLIEFHHKYLNMRSETKSTVTALRKADYKLFWMSDLGSEYGFIKGDLVRNGRAVPRRNIRL